LKYILVSKLEFMRTPTPWCVYFFC